eukprot:Filipodium_phascolosomae@DN3029_c0_g1_i1.p1
MHHHVVNTAQDCREFSNLSSHDHGRPFKEDVPALYTPTNQQKLGWQREGVGGSPVFGGALREEKPINANTPPKHIYSSSRFSPSLRPAVVELTPRVQLPSDGRLYTPTRRTQAPPVSYRPREYRYPNAQWQHRPQSVRSNSGKNVGSNRTK